MQVSGLLQNVTGNQGGIRNRWRMSSPGRERVLPVQQQQQLMDRTYPPGTTTILIVLSLPVYPLLGYDAGPCNLPETFLVRGLARCTLALRIFLAHAVGRN